MQAVCLPIGPETVGFVPFRAAGDATPSRFERERWFPDSEGGSGFLATPAKNQSSYDEPGGGNLRLPC